MTLGYVTHTELVNEVYARSGDGEHRARRIGDAAGIVFAGNSTRQLSAFLSLCAFRK
jgi:hypothetical protein